MTAEDLFAYANAAVLPGWLILIFAPRGHWVWLDRVPALIIPMAVAALYSGLILAFFNRSGGGFDSIAAVRLLFTDDYGLLAGWVHYLAFDLVIGAAMAKRMDRLGASRLLQAPLLMLVFLFGPLGVLLILGMQMAQLKGGRHAAI